VCHCETCSAPGLKAPFVTVPCCVTVSGGGSRRGQSDPYPASAEGPVGTPAPARLLRSRSQVPPAAQHHPRPGRVTNDTNRQIIFLGVGAQIMVAAGFMSHAVKMGRVLVIANYHRATHGSCAGQWCLGKEKREGGEGRAGGGGRRGRGRRGVCFQALQKPAGCSHSPVTIGRHRSRGTRHKSQVTCDKSQGADRDRGHHIMRIPTHSPLC